MVICKALSLKLRDRLQYLLLITRIRQGRDILKHETVAIPPTVVVQGVIPTLDDVYANAEVKRVHRAVLMEFRNNGKASPILNKDGLIDFIGHRKLNRLVLKPVANGTGVIDKHRIGIGTAVEIRVIEINRAGRSGHRIHGRGGAHFKSKDSYPFLINFTSNLPLRLLRQPHRFHRPH